MTELIMSAETLTKLQKIANQKKSTVEILAEQVICEYLRREARQIMQQEMTAFRAMHPELLTQYRGQFVAVHHGQVVDHDPDEMALYQRIDQQYPDIPVLLRQVRSEIEETLTIRSPRLQYA